MTVSVVQSIIQLAPSAGTSGFATLSSSPTSGNLLLFIQTVDKSAGTFTPPSGFTATTGIPATNSSISLWVGTKTSDGTESGAITCTWTNGNNWQTAIVELTGSGTFAVDVSQSNITASAVTTLSSGTTATTSANTDFGVAIFTNDSSGSASTETHTGGFTTFDSSENVGGNPGLWLASGSVTPSATAETTISALNSDQIAAAIVTFSDIVSGSYSLTCDSSSYTLSGTDAALRADRNISADSLSLTLSGTDCAVLASRVVVSDSGSIALSGTDAALTYTPSASYTLTADSASFAMSGTDASILTSRIIYTDSASFALSGTDAMVLAGRILSADSASFSLSGTDAVAAKASRISCEANSFALSGADVSLTYSGEAWSIQANSATSWSDIVNSTDAWARQANSTDTWTIQ